MLTSLSLANGAIYTREDLRKLFNITDATINTGVFQPRGHDSIWLFVTEKKTPDRTQYHDLLIRNTLRWDGQRMGRTDRKIVDHRLNGVELLVFYRKHKSEFAGGGFTYEGTFEYVSHSGSCPASFVLERST